MSGNTGGPWGSGGSNNSGGGGKRPGGGGRGPGDEGPQIPEIDELMKKGQEHLRVLMGGRGGTGGPRRPGGGGPALNRSSIMVGALALVALWAWGSFYRVNPEEQSVELFLGECRGNCIGQPGLNFAPWPLVSYEKLAVTREQTEDIGVGRSSSDAGLMLTGDENIVDIDFQVVWNIRQADQFLFNLREPEQTIRAVSESAMREIIAQSELSPILNRDRGPIADRLKDLIQSTLDGYDSGMNVVRVNFDKADPPREVTAVYQDASTVRIAWVADPSSPPQYRLYRGSSPASMELTGTFNGVVGATDPTLEAGKEYIYAVTALDPAKDPQESPRVYSRPLRPHETPEVVNIRYVNEGQLRIVVSQDMGSVLPSPQRFLLNGTREPESVALLDQRTLLLSFGALEDGRYGLDVRGLRDAEGIPFADRSHGPFDVVNPVLNECYVERVEYRPPRSFDVWFNQPVDPVTAAVPGNYEFQPVGFAQSAAVDPADARHVTLEIAEGNAIGALGREYVLKVRNVLCSSGAMIGDGPGSTAGVILNRQTLDDVFVYPNPLKPEHAQDFITFANLTPRATIRIYTLSGIFIAEVVEDDGNGGVEWDLRDEHGRLVPSGVYVYRAAGTNSAGEEVDPVLAKFAIIR